MINTVNLPGTALTSSVLGLGCASLGSRITRAHGLRALDAAFDAGVSWYDVAPAYGAGEAEPILGAFAKGKRDRLVICSKVGVVPPQHNGAMRVLYELGRPLLGVAKGLRKRFRKAKVTRNQVVSLNPDFIRSSLENTLRRIDTDYIDVLALHKVSVEDLSNPVIQATLADIVKSGKARHISIAGSAEASEAALAFPEIYSLFQLADNPTSQPLLALRAAAPGRDPAFVTHSVFGVDGAKDRITAKVKQDKAAREKLVAAGYTGSEEQMVADLLLDRALASNDKGVVLASMFSPRNLAGNVARASRPVNPGTVDLLQAVVGDDVSIRSVI